MRYREIFKVYSKVFDLQTFRNLDALKASGFIGEILIPISEGKESVVFVSKIPGKKVAVKIYKVMSASYKEQLSYLKMDPRYANVGGTKIDIIYSWVKKEYANLSKMYKSGVFVPMPIAFRGNILVMEFIGNQDPAPMLKDVEPQNPEKFFQKILKEYSKIYNKAKLVHGDISEFNILYFREKPVIIDVSQAIPVYAPNAPEFLDRDLRNIGRMGRKFGVEITFEEIREKILKKS